MTKRIPAPIAASLLGALTLALAGATAAAAQTPTPAPEPPSDRSGWSACASV